MGEANLAQVGPTAISMLALALSLVNLYLQRRDRRPRLEIRARYEYRTGLPNSPSEEDAPPPRWCDSLCPTQETRFSTWTTSGWSSALAIAS